MYFPLIRIGNILAGLVLTSRWFLSQAWAKPASGMFDALNKNRQLIGWIELILGLLNLFTFLGPFFWLVNGGLGQTILAILCGGLLVADKLKHYPQLMKPIGALEPYAEILGAIAIIAGLTAVF